MEIFFARACVVLVGLVLGSFATALCWRLPRGLSIVTVRRSHCPACGHTLGIADLIPVFSWLLLRGRCRHCRAVIGWRYPAIELATLALCLLFYGLYGLRPETALLFALAPVIVSIIAIDLQHKIIPDGLNLAVLLIGVLQLGVQLAVAGSGMEVLQSQGGAALGGSLLYGAGSLALRQGFAAALKREPMGLGDIKFFAAAGFWLGLSAEAAALFLLVAGVSGIGLGLVWKKMTGEVELPFGPSLALGFVAALALLPPPLLQF